MRKSDEIVRRFTHRAEELRMIASNIKDPRTRAAMLSWADDYDRLAERAIQLGTFGMQRKPEPERKSSDEVERHCSC